MRFRLKTDFLTYARDQIRGGLWYKPAWWDAVHRVPPTAFVPRVKKASIPRVRFTEDKLMRDFSIKNPAIARYDGPGRVEGDSRSVAAAFADKQIEIMKERGVSSDRAYTLARAWLIDHGPDAYAKLDLPPAVRAAAEATPEQVVAVKAAVEGVHDKQLALLSAALDRVRAARAADVSVTARRKPLPAYRSFHEEEDKLLFATRGMSDELVMPGKEGPRAAKAAAASSDATATSVASGDDKVDVAPSAEAAAAGGGSR